MAAINKAYEDAGRQLPEDLNPTNLLWWLRPSYPQG